MLYRLVLTTGIVWGLIIHSVQAEEGQTPTLIQRISQTSIPNAQSQIQVTGVQANPTEKVVEVILQTTQAKQLQITNRSAENNFIADIPNAQLRLPSGDVFTFRSENPVEGISEITVTNFDANTIRVTVAGETELPAVELFDSNEGLIFSFTPATTAMQPPQQPEPEQPTSETPPQIPSAQQDEPIELVVTGEQDGYRVPNATTATRTDTPLRDIPQSIQVIPRQILEDRNVTELRDALQTLGGVNYAGGRGSNFTGEGFLVRGFGVTQSVLRDGIPYFSQGVTATSDIEQIEVLRGPASVLFGIGEPGGIINLVSKQPLAEPYYSVSGTVGSFSTYRGGLDFSGPLNESRSVRYRLNASYDNYGSFRDFVIGENWSISPTLTWDISPNTSFNIYGQYKSESETQDGGIPTSGGRVVDVPRSRFLSESFGRREQDQLIIGYTLNHRFSKDWSVRHAFQFLQYEPVRFYPLLLSFNQATGNVSRLEYRTGETYSRLFTNAEVLGEFSTGSIKHKLLFGTEYRSNLDNASFQLDNPYPSINVFNPVYTRTPYDFAPTFFRDDNVSGISVYLQDQIDLLPNLKLLAGIRYDSFRQFRTERTLGSSRIEFEQTDSAWSPRFGIVYQPIQPLSLYASYTRSFAPSFGTVRNADRSAFIPTTGEQFEVGIKADLSNQLSFTLAAFDLRRQNVSTSDPDRPGFSIQTGEQTSRGIELNLAGEILPGWNMTASYAYLDAFVSQDNRFPVGNRLTSVPDHQFSLWTTYNIQQGDLQGLGFGLGLFYVGERQNNLNNTFALPSYFRTDAALFYRRDNWRVQLNVENLLNVDYLNPDRSIFVIPGKPRAVTASFAIEF
ncbi:MAG: TonB-dependent siderophore receptor [Goleter apudmare HA4340-LM2]|jgi:iron complex outermembrane receptor protein|nr:TonB-dependent siderophore receptor [Goleter apudmare HA4340-LM2]